MYLQKIIDYKKQELEHIRRRVSLKDLKHMVDEAEPTRDFLKALTGRGERHIIAEVKKASPSAGVIRLDFDPVKIARIYEDHGAAALSVLTDEHFFQGHLDHLKKIREVVRLPLLRKDFTFDEYQIYEARSAGADAILLIVRILEISQLKDYSDLAHELGIAALIEVHDVHEMKKVGALLAAPLIGARQGTPLLIGINNRDLDTLEVNLETSVTLATQAPPEAILIAESGLKEAGDLEKLEKVGIHSFLIGESLLKASNIGQKLEEFL